MPYIYDSVIYCDSCGEKLKAELPKPAGHPSIWDSNDYPVYAYDEPTDSPVHCGGGHECLEALDLGVPEDQLVGAETSKIGCIIGAQLTEDGRDYTLGIIGHVAEPTRYQEALHEEWMSHFDLKWLDVVKVMLNHTADALRIGQGLAEDDGDLPRLVKLFTEDRARLARAITIIEGED